ncbi:anoctamin-1-like isoform X2 [Saccostrea cucullata]|uniref:anoctamin-1-like isoform X2 n=1 Tax=Saccostrea cuccullata TaxID=36930 RepID=UPI002ED5D5CD
MAEGKGEKIPMLENKESDPDDTLNVTADTSEDSPLTSNEVMQSSQTNGGGKSAGVSVPGEMDDDHEDADIQDKKPSGRNMFFKKSKKRIDYILAWSTEGKPEKLAQSAQARAIFEENLKQEGLELEKDEKEGEEIHYLKVHAPYEVLTRYAEILKVRMPVKKSMDLEKIHEKYAKLEKILIKSGVNEFRRRVVTPIKAVSTRLWDTMTSFTKKLFTPFQVDTTKVKPVKRRFNLAYSRDKEYLFDIPEDRDTYFDNATRSRIVNFILRRKAFSKEKEKAFSFGINKMIADGHYTDAYPLHEGHWKPGSADNERKLLFDYWANWRNCFKVQPLDHVRGYFGEKIAIYFAWLGFYTQMLIPASLIGLIVFIYGCAISGNSYPANEICDESKNFTMCPLCDYQCPYWKLSAACSHARASRIFDNGATVFFAIFMSFWGTLFLEFWKRKQAALQFKWDLTDFVTEEQPPRPEFLAKLEHITTYKEHPITGIKEPHLPFWRKRFPIYLMSWTAMLFLAFLAIVAVVGVIAYRISTLAALQVLTKNTPVTNSTFIASTAEVIYQNASLVTTVTAACINLLIIIILNFIYSRLAFWLTDLECLRTQKEYDDSITLKLFSLQFVNYYSSIIYIAFFKGRMVGRPGKYATLFGGRQEECEAGGCLIELCIQLAIIMTGKQLIVNNIVEILIPKLIKWIKRKIWAETKEQKMNKSPWEKDYRLQPADTTSLFYEYLEMILQFGFLTLFVAAFPLGPLFALINNILEIRFDAVKFTTQLRRPMAERIPDIGIWYSVLYGISRIAIISNAFIIALTSDFIPRLVYETSYSKTGGLEGYISQTLSVFNTSDFSESHRPAFPGSENVETCFYRDFRNPPDADKPYEYSQMYWHILAARFAFVVAFENVIVVITGLIAWLIPDVPEKLKLHIRREAYMSNEIIIKTELLRAKGEPITEGEIEKIIEDENQRYKTNEMGSMELVHRKSASPEAENSNVV